MKSIKQTLKSPLRFYTSCLFASLLFFCGCEKFMEIPLPTDSVSGDGAYLSDNTTGAVVTGIFYNMYNSSTTFSGEESIGYRTGLYTDELQNLVNTNTNNQAFYTDNIQALNVAQWSRIYKLIYHCNIAINGIQTTKAELRYRSQWLGEALFSRAFLYYYLVNLYGDVPIALSPDVIANNQIGRSPKADVYQQILADLKQAKSLLGTDYKDGLGLNAVASATVTNVRSRPNFYAATSLLARVYLEIGDWTNAEAEASAAIGKPDLFQLVNPTQTYLGTSKEMIWGLSPTGAGVVREYTLFNNAMPANVNGVTGANSFGTYGVSAALSESLVNLFDKTRDLRFTNWVRSSTAAVLGVPSYFPNKYKSVTVGTEAIVALRLAEQFLIRAEARARLNNLPDAKTDLNSVRSRANLDGTLATTQPELIAAILKERQMELFTEFGFRFIDLKRTGNIDAVMGTVAPLKGGTWNSQKQIWPIPVTDIQANPRLTQAPGYN